VKSCLNIGEPSSKAKYVLSSDSEEYCEGKVISKLLTGEKEPELVTL